MKVLASSLLVLLSNASQSKAQPTEPSLLTTPFEMMEAYTHVNEAIDNFQTGNEQPACMDPTSHHVVCIDVPEDIDDTNFVIHPIVPGTATLGALKGTPDYDLGKGMIQGFIAATTSDGCDEAGKFALATYEWLSDDQSSAVQATSLVKSFTSGPEIGIWNTFQDAVMTGGAETVYDTRTAIFSDELEFPLFPMNFPPMEGGFYDIDLTESEITVTLKDNKGGSNLIFPEGTFDRYYFVMPSDVAEVTVVSSDKYVVEAAVVAPDTEFNILDLFQIGLVAPSVMGSNVISLSLQFGTDMTELEQVIKLEYKLVSEMVDTKYICGTDPLLKVPIEKEEEVVSEDVSLIPEQRNLNDLIEEFIWEEAPAGVDYDFVGTLEMCGGKAVEMDYPDYMIFELNSNAIFGYRQYGMSDNACGDDMAPLIRLQPGKTYKINFINSSESDTNLHTHGLHIGGDGYSDDVIRLIPAGMCGVYIWEIADNHASGMHWYHPHAHGWTYEQVRGRAFGPIFIDEPVERMATYPEPIQGWLGNQILVQLSTETSPSPILHGDGVKDGRCVGGFENCYPRANNKRTETVTMIEDEWYSLTVHNIVPAGTGKDVIKFFGADGTGDADCIAMIAGYDGVYRSKIPRPVDHYPEEPNYFHCNGASRLQLAIKCNSDATMKMGKEDSSVHHYGMEDPEIPIIIQINVIEGEKTIASPYVNEATELQWEPPRPQYLEDLTQWDGEVETWELYTEVLGLDQDDVAKTQPVFNGKAFHGGKPNHFATFGKVQEWSYYGSAGNPEGHPMHVHVNHMQILGYGDTTGVDCGPNMEYGEWVDTIRIKSSELDPCKARHRFNQYAGKVILHCHDLFHEDSGMMGLVMVEGGPESPWASTYSAPALECINVL